MANGETVHVARTSFVGTGTDGLEYRIAKGERVHGEHPIVSAVPELFVAAEDHVERGVQEDETAQKASRLIPARKRKPRAV